MSVICPGCGVRIRLVGEVDERDQPEELALPDVVKFFDESLRGHLDDPVVDGGFALVEIQREGKTLEDVFAELTK